MAFNFKRLSHFVYPPLCLHCQESLPQRIPLLCKGCLDQISLVSSEDRCLTCFSSVKQGSCSLCRQRPLVIRRQIAASERLGPAATLLAQLKQGNKSAADAMATLMAYQWLQYQLPLPDVIIPLPVFFGRPFNPSLLLAELIAHTFSVPLLFPLKKIGDWRAFLETGQFQTTFQVKRNGIKSMCDQKIVLITPTLDDSLLRKAAEALQPFFPHALYGLAFSVD